MKRAAKIGLTSFAFFVALLAAGEGAARVFHKKATPCWVPHPLFGRVHPPGYSGERISVDDGSTFTFTTNVLGLRGRSIETVKKPPHTRRIFFVGASTTENAALPEEKTFPAIVERLLNERTKGNPRIEVGNAGMSGVESATSVAQVANRLLYLEPDLIVALEGNDFFQALADDWDPTTYALGRWRPIRFGDWVQETSRLASWMEELSPSGVDFDPRPQFQRRARLRHEKPFRDPPDELLLRGRERFRKNLAHMALLCESEKVRFGLMTLAWLYKPAQPPDEDAVIWLTDLRNWNLSPAVARRGADAFNDVVRSVAAERGSLLVDLDKAIPHDLQHLVDDVHMNAKGNEVAARAIVDVLEKSGFARE